jgi:hypothetical protein
VSPRRWWCCSSCRQRVLEWPVAFESACWASWRGSQAQRPSSGQRQPSGIGDPHPDTPCIMQDAPDVDDEDRAAIRDTLRFFEVSRPTYSYSMSEAIADGHLAVITAVSPATQPSIYFAGSPMLLTMQSYKPFLFNSACQGIQTTIYVGLPQNVSVSSLGLTPPGRGTIGGWHWRG